VKRINERPGEAGRSGRARRAAQWRHVKRINDRPGQGRPRSWGVHHAAQSRRSTIDDRRSTIDEVIDHAE